jgi:hypothetical protein
MAWRISWHLECDHCRKVATFQGQPSSAIERKARQYRWAFVFDTWGLVRHLCPACAANRDTRALYEAPTKG